MPTLADPVAFTLFGLSVRWYAIFILTGIAVSIFVMRRLAAARGQDPEFVLDMTPLVVIAGIIGARIYYLLLRWDDYVDDPGAALNVRLGGLTIHGALVAGTLAFIGYCWWRRAAPVRLGGSHHRGRTVWTGDWALGKLGQSGSVRHADRSAVGGDDRSAKPAAAVRGVQHVSPDVSL